MAHRMVFSEVVGTLSFLQPESDDDIADRLHYYYTSTFLLVTAVLISIKMFGGRPIECWLPAEYKASWEDYTEIYCWAKSTYFVNFASEFPTEEQERQRRMVSYYQWTPFFLVFCALLFYSPCLLWRLLYGKSGIRIKDIVAFATDRSNIRPDYRAANVKGVAVHLGSVFQHRFRWGTKHPYHHKVFRILNLRFYEAYLTLLYIGIKVLFLANVLAQMFLMNWFLQTDDYNFYGWGVIQDLIHGRPWSESGNFPRVTYCDLDIRILGNIQKHTVQCVLVINIFIEKVFIMLWVWYSFLAIVTVTSLANWVFASIPFEARKRFIARRLELADVEFRRKDFKAELDEFVREYIKMDGVFVLKMITIHAGILVCTEILSEMWDDFLSRTGRMAAGPSEPGTPGAPPRRKTSVLVPLVSRPAHEYGQHAHTTIPTPRTPQTAGAEPFLKPPNIQKYGRRVRASSSTGLSTQRFTLGALSRQRRHLKGMPMGGGQQIQWSQLPAADQPASD